MDNQLRTIISDTLGIEAHNVKLGLSRETEHVWDSLNHLRLITAIEKTYAVRFGMKEIQAAMTVADLVALLKKHRAH